MPDPADHVHAVGAHVLDTGTSLARGHRIMLTADAWPLAGTGRSGRFSPVSDVSHAYVARLPTGALLETALRDVTPGSPTVYVTNLHGWAWSDVRTTRPLRLADLRDTALAERDIDRTALTAAPPRHYPCTGRWGAALHTAGFDGVLWHSRQADLHRAAQREGGLASVLLAHAPIEVAVVWSPPVDRGVLATVGTPHALLDETGQPSSLVIELASLLGLVLEV